MPPDGIDLVDEDNTGSTLLALLEQVTDAARAHSDEHFDEVRAGNRKERYVGLAGHGARQQRLACTGRTDQQDALGNPPAELLKLLRLSQELDDFL